MLPRAILWGIAVFYAFDAYEHVANIAGGHGLSGPAAPFKGNALDVAYLALDIIVIVGFMLRWRIGVFAFFAVAGSQVILYTLLRPWVADMQGRTTPTYGGFGYLDLLALLQVAAIVLVLVALWFGALKRDAEEE